MILLGFQNTKTFFLDDTFKIGQKFLLLVKLKLLFREHMWLVTWMVNQLLKVFMKKNCKKLVKKGEKLYIRWKGYNNSFNGCINKKDLIWKWVNTFLSGLEVLEEILTLKLIFQIVQQKQIKNISYVDTSSFALLNKLSQSKNWSW